MRALVSLIFAGVLVTTLAPTSVAGHLDCSVKANSPHWSAGSNGVISKGTVECPTQTTQVILIHHLYFCGAQQPQNNKDWLMANCDFYLSINPIIDSPTVSPNKMTRYAPPDSQAGVRRSGWFKSYTISTVTDQHSGSSKSAIYRDFSPSAQCSVQTQQCL